MTRDEEEALIRHLEQNRLERMARSKGGHDPVEGPESGAPNDDIQVHRWLPKHSGPPSTPDG